MMDRFLTEKQTERLLQTERRDLVLRDGSGVSVCGFRLMWETFEDLIRYDGYSHRRIVDFAVEETRLSKQPLDVTFPAVVAYLDAIWRSK